MRVDHVPLNDLNRVVLNEIGFASGLITHGWERFLNNGSCFDS